MITSIVAIILCFIFSLLSFIHFYWLFGGKWGLEKVIPTKNKELQTLEIPKFATLIVALVLILFGGLYLIKTKFFSLQTPILFSQYIYWAIPSIFIIRAIGDFNYVGFFKKIKNTAFAKSDTKWFVPLCLLIRILGFVLQFIS
jgi:glucan phosphoethanolaminetransferase (alkaline phosphatase superfamily)